MHIRKLELQGFKSFVDRQTFHFGTGIAGVVGPNGCGKSNIVDAIRWCIGEQSAKSLRGAAMQDVIFNGSACRKPVGMAEVVITFARDEGEPFPGEYARFEEVRVGRRLFRDGTSEYLLNQERVRRRDVVEFFMDTGVGNKLYSFIQQGEISRIVLAHPEERRALIEEAAGISKYKARREEAEQKLAATAQNLERATDLAEEMGRRLRALERQVEKAARFRRLRAQLRQGELFLGLVKYAGLAAERRELTGELRVTRERAERLARELERRDGDLRLQREEIAVMNAVVTRLRDEQAEAEAQRRERESARHFQAKEQGELRARLGVLAHDLDDAGRQLERAAGDAQLAEAELIAAREALEGQERAASDIEAENEATSRQLVASREQVERVKREVMRCITGLVQHRTSLGGLGQRRAELEERLAQLAREGEGASVDTEALALALEHAREEVEAADLAHAEALELVEEGRQGLAQAEAVVAGAKREVAQAERALHEAERAATKVEARLHATRELAQAHAGVEGGARRVLTALDTHGTLAEHLQVPESLESALTAALGAALDTVLLRSEADLPVAAAAVGKAGRARLLVVPDAAPLPTHGLAAEVGGTELGRRALGLLIGDMRRCADLEAALASRAQGTAALVTDGGEVLLGDGSVLVGQPEAGSGAAILRRQRQLTALVAEHEAHGAVVEARGDELERAREALAGSSAAIEGLRRQGDAQRAAAESRRLALAEARMRLREREREQLALAQREAQLRTQRERLVAQLGRMDEEAATHAAAISRDEERQQALEDELREAQSTLVRLESAAHELRERLARARTERGATRERVVLLERSLTSGRERAAEAARRQARAEAEAERAEARLMELVEAQDRTSAEVARLLEAQGELATKLAAERTRLERGREALATAEDGLRGLRTEVDAASAQASRLELRLQETRLGIDALRGQVEERHQVSLPGLLDRMERDAALVLAAGEEVNHPLPERVGRAQEPLADLRLTPTMMQSTALVREWVARVEQLRADLDKLGEVNLAALQEFEEVAERFDWLEAQRVDLDESVATIRRTIAKINRTCRERFRETFDEVNRHFQQLYPSLAGGGQGRLTLTNEEDLLETGVDIFVQPPGKRLQNLTLLSGGEKALCATGLIFALFRVRPSPFCVLDEVDAPLDEGNGARFNEVLREMSSLTQFIVITHVKKTMESVDVLYGVTMPDPGVSRLVTVNVS